MNDGAMDPWRERLSEYVDGELEPALHAAAAEHLQACASCRDLERDLRAIVDEARALGGREPGRDLWPAIRSEVEREQPGPRTGRRRLVPSWVWGVAAGVVLTLGARLALERARRGDRPPVQVASEQFLLLLHEPEGSSSEGSGAEHAAVVERYARWAEELGALCAGGEELEDGGFELRRDADPLAITARDTTGDVGGFFLVQAADQAEALALARTCPHLDRGGWIELRRIRSGGQ